jgi:hypothetical protein
VAELVSSEFFEQGDIERQELKITPIVSSINMLQYMTVVECRLPCNCTIALIILMYLHVLSLILHGVVKLER